MKESTWQGRWWFPQEEDRSLPGRLTLSRDDFVLELEGDLQQPPPPLKPGESRALEIQDVWEPIILGRTRDGERVTLVDCQTISMGLPVKADYTSWQPTAALLGAHLGTQDELVFDRIDFELDYLPDWSGPRRLGHSVGHSENGDFGSRVEIVAERQELATAPVAGSTVRVISFPISERDNDRATISVHTKFEVEFGSPLGWREALEKWLRPLEALVELGTLSSARIQDIRMRPMGSASESRLIFRSTDRWMPPRDDRRLHQVEMLFSMGELPSGFATAMARWFELYSSYEPVLELLLSVDAAPVVFVEQRFLSYAQAAEVFHSKAVGGTPIPKEKHKARVQDVIQEIGAHQHKDWVEKVLKDANWLTLRNRLEWLVDHLPDELRNPLTQGNRDKFVGRVVATRNYLTHRGDKDNYVLEGEDRFWYSHALAWILRFYVATELLGFPPDALAAKIGANNRFSFLALRLERLDQPD